MNKANILLSWIVLSLSSYGVANEVTEPVGMINPVPSYQDYWVHVRDFGSGAMSIEGRVLIIDPTQDTLAKQYKGTLTASFTGMLEHGRARNEFYVVETFWSRGGRGGDRTDVVTIWDPQALTVVDEIEIPPGRLTGVPHRSATGLIGNERFLGVYNFSPAQSVSIVDLEQRRFVEEIPIAGCGLVVPSGERSFISLCSDGSLRATHLQSDGSFSAMTKTEDVFDPQNDALFDAPAYARGVAYFASYGGNVLPIDISNDEIVVGDSWALASSEDAGWRPGGIHMITVDGDGLGYVLMHPDGAEGSHANGGSEVWVFDFANKERLGRISLETWGVSIGTSGSGERRYLFVMNSEREIDMYSIPSGRFIKSLDVGAFAPLQFQGLQE